MAFVATEYQLQLLPNITLKIGQATNNQIFVPILFFVFWIADTTADNWYRLDHRSYIRITRARLQHFTQNARIELNNNNMLTKPNRRQPNASPIPFYIQQQSVNWEFFIECVELCNFLDCRNVFQLSVTVFGLLILNVDDYVFFFC